MTLTRKEFNSQNSWSSASCLFTKFKSQIFQVDLCNANNVAMPASPMPVHTKDLHILPS